MTEQHTVSSFCTYLQNIFTLNLNLFFILKLIPSFKPQRFAIPQNWHHLGGTLGFGSPCHWSRVNIYTYVCIRRWKNYKNLTKKAQEISHIFKMNMNKIIKERKSKQPLNENCLLTCVCNFNKKLHFIKWYIFYFINLDFRFNLFCL